MSYRINVQLKKKGKYISDFQLLGNNCDYKPLRLEFEKQGIDTSDEDGCYKGQLFEINPIVDVLERYIWDMAEERKDRGNIFDLTPTEDDKRDLTYAMRNYQECAYMFVSANFINFLEKHNAVDILYGTGKNHYKLKEGYELFVDAG